MKIIAFASGATAYKAARLVVRSDSKTTGSLWRPEAAKAKVTTTTTTTTPLLRMKMPKATTTTPPLADEDAEGNDNNPPPLADEDAHMPEPEPLDIEQELDKLYDNEGASQDTMIMGGDASGSAGF